MTFKKPAIVLPGTGFQSELSEAQHDCIDKLRDALEQAEAGKITSCAIIVVMKGGYGSTIAGKGAADLYLACGSLQRKILDTLEKPVIKL